jgi:hypothetical protein
LSPCCAGDLRGPNVILVRAAHAPVPFAPHAAATPSRFRAALMSEQMGSKATFVDLGNAKLCATEAEAEAQDSEALKELLSMCVCRP